MQQNDNARGKQTTEELTRRWKQQTKKRKTNETN